MQNTEFKIGTCGLCGNSCAIGANVKDGRIISVEKLNNHPYLMSDICVRGAALKQFIYHPDRIEHPMKRVGSGDDAHFEPVSWDEAISAISARLLQTRQESGAKSTIFYAGHPKWFRKVYAELSAAYGTPNFVTESSTCRSATAIGTQLVCGSPILAPDMANCDVYVNWTENNSGQQGYIQSFVKLKEAGKKMIVVDPHKNALTEIADLHLQPYPGTDGALALGIANIIIANGLEDKEYIKKYTYGFEAYKEYVREFTTNKVAEITGISAEQIYKAAGLFTSGKVAIKCSNCSFMQGINGVQNLRAVLLLAALTGNIGVKGGIRPVDMPPVKLDTFHHDLAARPDIDDDISKGEFPVWNEIINNEGQCIRLADVILNEDPYPIRNFIAFGMNIGMWPECGNIIKALNKVEFSVIIEQFWNEACKCADYVLPACTAPERDHVMAGNKNRLLFLEHLIDPGDKLPDVEIMLRLAHAMDLHGPFLDQPDYDSYLNYTMRKTGITLDELKACPDGIDIRTITPPEPFNLETGIHTPSEKIEFVSRIMEKYSERPGHDPLPAFTDWRKKWADMRTDYPFDLVSGARKPYYFHSRTFRLAWISNLEPHTSLSICREDADSLHLKEGDRARLTTPNGSMEYYVMIDSGLKRGVVYVYHDDGRQNINRIMDKDNIDPVSGFPGYRTYICKIEPVN